MAKVTKKTEQEASSLNQKEAFFLKYKKVILIAIVAVIVAIGAIFAYNEWVAKPAETEASTALAKCEQYLFNGQPDKALNGDKATCKGFKGVASDYSSTKAGNLANLYAALCYAHQEKPDWKNALVYAEKFEPGSDMTISPLSQMALGDIYANNNQLDKAVENFKKAAEMANKKADGDVNFSIAPVALKKAAIILESQKKTDEANAIYKDIKENYVRSAVWGDIDKYIERTSK